MSTGRESLFHLIRRNLRVGVSRAEHEEVAEALDRLETLVESLRAEYAIHLKTGDYVRLGIKTQDALREFGE